MAYSTVLKEDPMIGKLVFAGFAGLLVAALLIVLPLIAVALAMLTKVIPALGG